MSSRTPELADIIRQAIEDRLAEVNVMLPGRIDSYDANLQKADVEPLIRRLQQTVDGEINEALPVIPGVPILFMRAGGFKITTPVNPGDRCMLVFCQRSIETYQTGDGRRGDNTALITQADPETFEMHSLSDPVAVMGWYTDAEALSPAPHATDMVIGNEAGGVIQIAPDGIYLWDESGSHFVALANKVLDELNKLAGDINTLKAVFSAWVPVPQDGGAALKLAAATWYGSSVSMNSVSASKVKAI